MDTEKFVNEENGEAVENTANTGDTGAAADPVQMNTETTVPETAGAEGPQAEPAAGQKEKKTFLRASGSWTDIIPIAAMLSFIVINFGAVLSWILDSTVFPAMQIASNLLGDADSARFLLDYFEFYGIWIMFMIVILLFKDNWPMWKAFLYNGHGNNLKAIPAGILLGFGMNGFCILMSWIMGDIKLSYSGFAPIPFFAFLLCVMIQSGAEEIIDRCYLYQKLRRRYRWPIIAVVVNALVFMAMHMPNPGVTKLGLLQVFLIGVLFSLIVYYWDSLWTVIWAHTAWNFSQSIVFGLPNSGIVSKYSVFKLEAASARDGIFYNTSFGVEGSIGANAMIAAFIVVVLIYGLVTKRGEKKDHWEELENRNAGRNHIWEAVVLTVIMMAIIAAAGFGTWWMNEHADQLQQYIDTAVSQTEEAEGQEDSPEGQPADTEGQPAGTEGQPAGTESQPAGTEGQPAGTESQPADTESQAAGAETQAAALIPYRFASREEGAELMLANDKYYAGFSQNDLDYKMQKKGATMEEYQAFAREQVRDFTPEEKTLIDGYFADMEKTLKDNGYKLPPLEEIVLIKTTMKEENDVGGYTHGTQIYISERVLNAGLSGKENAVINNRGFFWHELFHCLTRCNPQFRADLYKLIHFTVQQDDYKLPPSVAEYHISNPDVEHHNSYATFRIGGKDIDCFTDLITTRHFEKEGDSFFDNATIALVPVDGTDIYYTPEQAENFDEIFGKNTEYVIDPEECMADNFAYALCFGKEGPGQNGYPNPEIIEGILEYISR